MIWAESQGKLAPRLILYLSTSFRDHSIAEQKSQSINSFIDSFPGAEPRFLTNANVTVNEQSRERSGFELGVLFSAIPPFFVYLSPKHLFLLASPYRKT
jgi:hypothetical protein